MYVYVLAVLGLLCCERLSLVTASRGLLSGCCAQDSHCGSFSWLGLRALEYTGFSSCGTWT